MWGNRLVLLLAMTLIAVPLSGCFGDEEQPPADPGTNTNTTPDGNTTLPDGNTTVPGGPGVPGAPKPSPVNETGSISMSAPTPPATAPVGSATGTATVAPGWTSCKLTLSTSSQTFAQPQTVTVSALDAAGTAIASATLSGGAPGSAAAPVTADCSTEPAAAGTLTYTITGGQALPNGAIGYHLEVLY